LAIRQASITSHDPKEDKPEYRTIFEEAEKLTQMELKDIPKDFGFCHRYWYTKQRILKERFNVNWRTPAELNPHICYD